MTRRMIWMLVISGIIFGGIIGFLIFRGIMIKNFLGSMGTPPTTVATYTASELPWTPMLKIVGSLRAINGVDIASEIAGVVSSIPFTSGSEVAKGDLLLKLDAEDAVARLQSLKASAMLARQNFQRSRDLLKLNAVSQAALDQAAATLKSAEAQVVEQQEVVKKKEIRAPFAGRVGIRLVDVGQYVTAGQKVTTLQTLDPILLDFFIPQRQVNLLKKGQTVTATSDAFPELTFTGKISAIDPKADPQTRNVSARAELSNPDHKLLPGMFASASITVGEPVNRITLPQVAVTYNPYGETVYIVDSETGEDGNTRQIARQKFVVTGETRGDQVAIEQGVKVGDTVVTSGQFKLKNGSPITINNELPASNDPAPQPVDE